MNALNHFQQAETYRNQSDDQSAKDIYLQLVDEPQIGAVSHFRLGEIYNREGSLHLAIQAYENAFFQDPLIAKRLTRDDHPNHFYVYEKEDEIEVDDCPLCNGKGNYHSAYNLVMDNGFVRGFNPIRIWMYCKRCNHIFARSYPRELGRVLSDSAPGHYKTPKPQQFPIMSQIISNIIRFTEGKEFLEVGVGAGEMSAVAKEMLFNVTGIEIRPSYANAVSKMFNIPVLSVDFDEFHSGTQYDVICMGDVIEHLTNPFQSLKKAKELLKPEGVLWISTPNFESASAYALGDRNPMWKTTQHLNYFSYESLKNSLEQLDFDILDYKVSSRYVGSMEIVAKKKF